MIWKYLFKESSFKEVGTLYHLRNVLQRTNVVHDPKNDYNACSDFFQTIVEGHVIAATMEAFGMDTVNDTPKHTLLPESIHAMPVEEQETMLYLAMKDVVANTYTWNSTQHTSHRCAKME